MGRLQENLLEGLSATPTARYSSLNVHTQNGFVDFWGEFMGGFNLTQATTTKRPALIQSALNGRPGVRFDGVDDFFTVTYTLAQPFTRLLIYKQIVVGASGGQDAIADGGTLGNAAWTADTTPRTIIQQGSGLAAAGSFGNGVAVAMLGVYDNQRSAIYQLSGGKNTSLVQGTIAGGTAAGGITLGAIQNGTRAANVEIYEAIDIPVSVSDQDRAILAGYALQAYLI